MRTTKTLGTGFFLLALAALLSMSSVYAYPGVTIVTDGNTFSSNNYYPVQRVVAGTSNNPYVSGAEYTYRSPTYDYVDGYRDGYGQALSDSRLSSRSREPGLSCDRQNGLCFYRYTPCDSGWCRVGDSRTRVWSDNRLVVFEPYSYPHYGFAVNNAYLSDYWRYY